MTGTYEACLHTNQSRSYLNHLVYIYIKKQKKLYLLSMTCLIRQLYLLSMTCLIRQLYLLSMACLIR